MQVFFFFYSFGLGFTCYFGNRSYHSRLNHLSLLWLSSLSTSCLDAFTLQYPPCPLSMWTAKAKMLKSLTYSDTMFVFTCHVFDPVDTVNPKLVGSVDIKPMATRAHCNWLSLNKSKFFSLVLPATMTEMFWIHFLPQLMVLFEEVEAEDGCISPGAGL